MKWEKRLYKPTGPDGKGWGDFRQINENDLQVLQEFQKVLDKEVRKAQSKGVDALQELK